MSMSDGKGTLLLDQFGNPIGRELATNPNGKDEQQHSFDPNSKKNFDQKIYMFPESYNALRKELMENWPNLWAIVSWRMAYRAEEFIECMNEALDLQIAFDTTNVAWICDQYLTALRKKRGLNG